MKITSLLSVALLALMTAKAGAQTVAETEASPATPRCTDSIPESALTRVPVYAAVTMADMGETPVPPVAANMLQSVVDRVETMLGGTPGSLPRGEPRITWDSISSGLVISWHRDGRVEWRLREQVDRSAPPGTGAARLLATALDSARNANEIFMPWPSDLARDSVEMLIYFPRPMVDETGKVTPVDAKVAIPIFTVAAPWQRGVALQRRPPKPHYPEKLLWKGIEGKVTLQFVVDTTGRADSLTFRDLWPRGEPRLEGEQAAYYKELVEAAKVTVMQARFTPAEVAGCKVRQVVQQPFTWLVR